jgi:hypothetical protein
MKTTVIALSLLALGADALAGTRLDPQAPQGAIGGRIEYPGNGVTPPMRICVLPIGTGAGSRCVDSPSGRTLYRIDGLRDGDYQVVARVDAAETPVAGHVAPGQCALAPCPTQLLTVTLERGGQVATANLNGFYAQRSDFPAVPAGD